jgi:hypothetical protein
MLLLEKIRKSDWWTKAEVYKDRHHDPNSGIMLTDHLISVFNTIDAIFSQTQSQFYNELFSLLDQLQLDKDTVRKELQIVALLHDIGKTEDDKTLKVEHPLKKELVPKRHPVVGVQAAIDILNSDDTLNDSEKTRIYYLVDEHDTPFGFYRQFEKTGIVPEFKSWKKLNNKIDTRSGVGLLYLLLFKLADIDGHEHIDDVIWFFKAAKEKYFDQVGVPLPIPSESDIR